MKKSIKRIMTGIVSRVIYYIVPSQVCDDLSIEKAETILEKHSANPKSSPLCTNTLLVPEYDLEIIVPVSNVEKYLDRCIQSILD